MSNDLSLIKNSLKKKIESEELENKDIKKLLIILFERLEIIEDELDMTMTNDDHEAYKEYKEEEKEGTLIPLKKIKKK